MSWGDETRRVRRPDDPDPTRVLPGEPGGGGGDSGDPPYYSRTYRSSQLRRRNDRRGEPAREPRSPRSPRPSGARGKGGRRRTGKRVLAVLLTLVVLYVLAYVGIAVASYVKLDHVAALPDYSGRPAQTPGQDWLLVGSDSRAGLTKKQQRRMHTGHTGGQRADTTMLLHIPSGPGKATLVSLPRDSYVPIPGHGRSKLNAAYAVGGPQLLTRTVEQVTGIRLDHYMEVGFGGFANAVDAVGGVRICVKKTLHDPVEDVTFRQGCQVMKGRKALLYVRSRHSDPRGDFARVEHQRQFLGALFGKAASPGRLLNPVATGRVAFAASDGLTVDDDTGVIDLGRLFLTMRKASGGGVKTLTVPTAGGESVSGVGSVVLWDRDKALRLFDELSKDQPVTVH